MICCAKISYLPQNTTGSNLRCLFPILSEMIVILFVFVIVLSVNLQRIHLQITTSPTTLISLLQTLTNRSKLEQMGLNYFRNKIKYLLLLKEAQLDSDREITQLGLLSELQSFIVPSS